MFTGIFTGQGTLLNVRLYARALYFKNKSDQDKDMSLDTHYTYREWFSQHEHICLLQAITSMAKEYGKVKRALTTVNHILFCNSLLKIHSKNKRTNKGKRSSVG